MKLAGTVILYYPGTEVIFNIQSYVTNLECLYVIDNSEVKNEALVQRITELKKTIYLHDGENKGIAVRLNQAAKLAINDGYTLLLTMDQDSHFTQNNIEAYLKCISSFENKGKVSMFGVQYIDKQSENDACLPQLTEKLITSGSFVNLGLFELTGGFDENLFIDEVDLEYCYRSIKKGLQIIQFNNIFLEHHLGNKSYHRSLKNLRKTPRVLHSPTRIYYMTRNYYYLNEKYKYLFPQDTTRRKKSLINRIKNNILYGKQKLKTIKYIFKAIQDYKKKNMGKMTGS